MGKIFVVGSVNMDIVINVDRMPKNGETISGYGFMTNPGGKGANQAVASAKMGTQTFMVGCIGNDVFGQELNQALIGYGVNTDFLTKTQGASGIAVIVVENGDNRIILDAGANHKITKEMVDKALEPAQKGDIVICQLEIPLDIVEYTLKTAKQKELITILNPAPAVKLGKKILSNCDIIVLNETECEILAGVYPNNEGDYKKAYQIFSNFGITTLIITLGSKGSVLLQKDVIEYIPAQKVKALDTTSAGDTFLGSLASELSKGKTMVEAMQWGSKASALTVTKKGAMQSIPYYEDVVKYFG
ncbi:MAG TPA: ribokinase [Clostridia bacterium]